MLANRVNRSAGWGRLCGRNLTIQKPNLSLAVAPTRSRTMLENTGHRAAPPLYTCEHFRNRYPMNSTKIQKHWPAAC